MRSGLLIGAAMAVLTARLVAGNGDGPAGEPAAATRAASAAAALLTGAAASSPMADHAPLHAANPAALATMAASVPSAMPAERVASGNQALHAATVEAEVMARRANGEGEDAVYRARAAQLPAADLAHLMAAEAAEAAWRRKLAASPSNCTADCEAAPPEHVVAAAYRRDAAPRLTLE